MIGHIRCIALNVQYSRQTNFTHSDCFVHFFFLIIAAATYWKLKMFTDSRLVWSWRWMYLQLDSFACHAELSATQHTNTWGTVMSATDLYTVLRVDWTGTLTWNACKAYLEPYISRTCIRCFFSHQTMLLMCRQNCGAHACRTVGGEQYSYIFLLRTVTPLLGSRPKHQSLRCNIIFNITIINTTTGAKGRALGRCV